jgi:hypothetical protein
MRRAPCIAGLGLAAALAAGPSAGDDLRDLHFGEAFFYAHQGQFFEALERLDTELGQHRGLDEPQRDSLHFHVNQAEFSIGDFELNYRMHHRAGRAIRAVLEGNVDEAVRNEAAFRLARIHFQKDQPLEALHALDRIQGNVPEAIREESEFLRANVYMALLRPADAVVVLKRLQGAKKVSGFSEYNLGIALLQEGQTQAALQQLAHAGQIRAFDPVTLAIRDKSNMVLGKLQFDSSNFEQAQRSFDRVRLEGAFSNQALLSAGWADVSARNFARAVVPWGILAGREVTDGAVQEALLALPFAYSKLDVHGRAALLYGRALEVFDGEMTKLDASIESVESGSFLQALVREEIRQSKDWVIRLRALPDAPETYYLMTLMASHDFQTALQNYLDLDDLRNKMAAWQRSFDAFEDLIRLRQANYEPLLPTVDADFRELASQIRLALEQREHLRRRLQDLLTAPRPELLADTEERILMEQIRRIEVMARLGESRGPEALEIEQRIRRLKGTFVWTLRTQYPERLTEAHAHLAELNGAIDGLMAQHTAFVRTRQAAVHSYTGYDAALDRLRRRVEAGLETVDLLMARQGRLIEAVAIDELKMRRGRLETYRAQARYAVADSYDRAVKLQATGATQ